MNSLQTSMGYSTKSPEYKEVREFLFSPLQAYLNAIKTEVRYANLITQRKEKNPFPLPFFSFTGWKQSFYGDLHAYGKQAVRFYTETKTVTERWFEDDEERTKNLTINLE